MSVLEQIRDIERHVERRLRELVPLVAEYRDLEKVAERLGLKRTEVGHDDAPAASPQPLATRAASKAEASPRSGAAKRSARATTARPSAGKSKPRATSAAAGKRAASKRSRAAASPKPGGASAGGSASGETATRRRRQAAAPGARQRDVLRLVHERPGISVTEIAMELGVDATGLYGIVRRLQAGGQITKQGTALRSVAAAPSPQDAPAAAAEAPATGSATDSPATQEPDAASSSEPTAT